MVKRGGVWTVVWGLAALTAWAGMGVAATTDKDGRQPGYHPGRVLVKFRKDAPSSAVQATVAAAGLTEIRAFPGIGVHVMGLAKGRTVEDAIATLMTGSSAQRPVLYAEPDYRVKIADVFPDDPYFPQQWSLHNTGQTGGTPDADIDAPEAWQISTSACDILVAVIDTGVDYTHPDLACNIWTNPGEIPSNGLDDDGNGYVDDVHGYDFCNYDPDPMDDHSHGTHVSGSIGACTDNGTGVSGVSWCVQIMALKFLDAGGGGYTSDAIAAIEYATMMGAKLSNNSWGGGGYSEALRDAIANADAAGILFIAAAGNYAANNDITPFYPASYDLPNIISVAATECSDYLASFSHWGPTTVDLGAPGVGIMSTLPGGGYSGPDWCGTSMATPHVSGAAALVWGTNPSLTHYCVKAQLLSTVDQVPGLEGKVVSGGRLNLNNALLCDATSFHLLPAPGPGFTPGAWNTVVGQPSVITAYVTDCCPAEGAAVTAAFDNGDPDVPLLDDGLGTDPFPGDGVFCGTWVPGAGGDVNVTITATEEGHIPGIASFVARVATNACYMYDIVAFEWEDISATGTLLPELYCDDCYTLIPESFDFEFYGFAHDTVAVSSNGTIYFQDAYLGYGNVPIPGDTGYGINEFIAPFWDDLYLPTVYYEIRGVAPERRLIVQWQNTQHCCGTPGTVTFQAILYEATGEIKLQYLDTTFDDPSYDWGLSATVGVQADPSKGLQFSFNQPALYDGLAISFRPDQCRDQVLLVQDAYPWGNNTAEAALAEAGIGYTIISSAQLASTDLSGYCAVMYTSDQPCQYYQNLGANIARIEDFVANGGVLLVHACDLGWNCGRWDWEGLYILPGSIRKVAAYQDNIHILEPAHPVVTGLDDSYFYGWYYSTHGYFTNVPPGTTVVMESNPGEPTYIEYPFGAGRVLATMQTSEWGYSMIGRPEFLRNELAYLGQIMCGGVVCTKTLSTPDEVRGWPDQVVSVPVLVDDPSGIMGFDITLEYCGDWLTPVSVTPGDCLDETWSLYPDLSVPGQVRVIGFSLAGPLLGTEECALFNVELAISGGAPLGSRCQLVIPSAALSDDQGNPIEPVCMDPGEVVVPMLDHLHFSVDPAYDIVGAGVECPMAVAVTCEAHDPNCGLVDLDDVAVSLSTSCGMTVDPGAISLWDGAWTAPVSISSLADEVCDACSLQGAIEGAGQWSSDPLTLRGKGDLDANCSVQIFDVIRAVNIMLGTPVTPPNLDFQAWAADTDCSNGHPCGNSEVQIFDLVRMIRYMLDGVWPCGGPAGGQAAAAGPVRLSLESQRAGDEIVVAVRVGRAQGLAGLDLTVNWQTGNLGFLGASAGSLANSNWLVQAQQGDRSVRVVCLDAGGTGVSGKGDLVLLRFLATGRTKQLSRMFTIGSVSASDASGNALTVAR